MAPKRGRDEEDSLSTPTSKKRRGRPPLSASASAWSECKAIVVRDASGGFDGVRESLGGFGPPYAPEGFPRRGDTWKWKVGRRIGASGRFWVDRYLFAPERIQKLPDCPKYFHSKVGLEAFLQKHFPHTDLAAFFKSFQWRIPVAAHSLPFQAAQVVDMETDTDMTPQHQFTPPLVELSAKGGSKRVTMNSRKRLCKAGNAQCGLLVGKLEIAKRMSCDICCSESGFCGGCSCILCGNATDQSLEDFQSIKCEGKSDNESICGHVAHLECALLSHVAGVEKKNGLDVQYYCRRCDKKTDLMNHVKGLVCHLQSLKSNVQVENNLSLAFRVIHGTKRGAKIFQTYLESALNKIRSGINPTDIPELKEIAEIIHEGKLEKFNKTDKDRRRPLNVKPVACIGVKAGDLDSRTLPSENGPDMLSVKESADDISGKALRDERGGPDMLGLKEMSSDYNVVKRSARLRSLYSIGVSTDCNAKLHARALKIEEKIQQSLIGLKESQEMEYELAKEKLDAQKNLVLSLAKQQLSPISRQKNSSYNDSDEIAKLRNEIDKLKEMLTIRNGFGCTKMDVLEHFFGTEVE